MRTIAALLIAAAFGWLAEPALAAVPLRLCVLAAYDARDDAVGYFISYYGEDNAHPIASDSRKEDCDVIVRLTQKGNFLRHGKLTADVESAYSGAKLLHVEKGSLLGDNRAQAARNIKEAIALGTDVFARVDAERRQAGFSPVAAGVKSQGISRVAPAATEPQTPAVLSVIEKPSFSAADKIMGDNDLAVIIGIERYQRLPASDYSFDDAALVKEYAKALGFKERNIELITNEKATKSSIEKSLEAWLKNRAKSGSRVLVYYSGHGAPDPATGESYLVPHDGDPNYLSITGYPLKRLYDNLGKLQAAEVTVVLDACFSGAGGRSVLAKGARPLVTTTTVLSLSRNIAVLAATQATQISASSPEKGHGVLTYYFLKALKDGKMTLSDIYAYIKPLVEDEAHALNIEQSPSIIPASEKLKGRFALRR